MYWIRRKALCMGVSILAMHLQEKTRRSLNATPPSANTTFILLLTKPKMADRHRSSDDDEGELEDLESDVNQMAAKIAEYRKSLPGQLTTTLASILDVQRPVILSRFDVGSEPGPSADSTPDAGRPVESGSTTLLAEEDKEYAEKIELLKQKLSSNASAMPNVLKRMKECISRIDKLESCNGIIHPAFKRKRTS